MEWILKRIWKILKSFGVCCHPRGQKAELMDRQGQDTPNIVLRALRGQEIWSSYEERWEWVYCVNEKPVHNLFKGSLEHVV